MVYIGWPFLLIQNTQLTCPAQRMVPSLAAWHSWWKYSYLGDFFMTDPIPDHTHVPRSAADGAGRAAGGWARAGHWASSWLVQGTWHAHNHVMGGWETKWLEYLLFRRLICTIGQWKIENTGRHWRTISSEKLVNFTLHIFHIDTTQNTPSRDSPRARKLEHCHRKAKTEPNANVRPNARHPSPLAPGQRTWKTWKGERGEGGQIMLVLLNSACDYKYGDNNNCSPSSAECSSNFRFSIRLFWTL